MGVKDRLEVGRYSAGWINGLDPLASPLKVLSGIYKDRVAGANDDGIAILVEPLS